MTVFGDLEALPLSGSRKQDFSSLNTTWAACFALGCFGLALGCSLFPKNVAVSAVASSSNPITPFGLAGSGDSVMTTAVGEGRGNDNDVNINSNDKDDNDK